MVINNGSSSAPFWYTNDVAGTYTITVSDNATTSDGTVGIDDATDNLSVIPVPIIPTKFVILDPGSATVDSAVTVTIEVQDNAGSVDTTYNGAITLNKTGSATGGGLVTIVGGVGTKAVSDVLAETINLTLSETATSGLNISSSRNLTFAPGVIAQFSVVSPGDMAAGTRQAITIGRKDQFGNGVTLGLTTAYLYGASANPNKRFYDSAASGSAITSVNFIGGVSTTQVWYYDETSATTTVTASDNATSSDGIAGVADASAFVHVVPGPVAKFLLNNPGNMSMGTRLGYTVTRRDVFDNNVVSGVTLAYFYSNSTGANKKFYDSVSGGFVTLLATIDDGNSSAQVWYFDDEPGTWTITVSDSSSGPNGTAGVLDATDNITVSTVPIVATRFVISVPGSFSQMFPLNSPAPGEILTRTPSGATPFNPVTFVSNLTQAELEACTGGPSNFTVYVEGNNYPYQFAPTSDPQHIFTTNLALFTPVTALALYVGADRNSVVACHYIVDHFTPTAQAHSQVGTPVMVNIQAVDNSGNLQTDYTGSVTLNLTGSATGGGVINLANGVGTSSVNDLTVEDVNLSLTDSAATGLDISSVESIVFQAGPVLEPGFTGTGGTGGTAANYAPVIGGVSFSGWAFPGAMLSIVAFGEQATIITQSTVADPYGVFNIDFRGILTGARSYGLLVQDKNGQAAQAQIFDVNLRNSSDILQVSSILPSPTVSLFRSTVTKGDRLSISGYATPGAVVSFEVDDAPVIETATAGTDGFYSLSYRTGDLAFGSHTVWARQFDVRGKTSGFSILKVFNVSDLLVPQVDFNNDGIMNIQDWSVFLARWISADPAIQMLDDLNGDLKVDISDFSIFIRTLRIK